MAAFQWNPRLDRGAAWRRTLRYVDAEGVGIPVQAPGFMDLRTRPEDDAALIARLDSTGSANGLLSFSEGNAVTLSFSDEATRVLPPGKYYYDLFVTGQDGEFIRLVFGVVTIQPNVSVLL